ncbi:MAG: hypothetical protein K5894_09325 [Lachnospiraceae bacterium]|nr:hypothetical protein [Lachnospiraceae bacterium]
MMNEYKNDIENIHASEELIQKTLDRVRAEENKEYKEKKKSAKIVKISSAIALSAAAVLLVVNLSMLNKSDYFINEIDQMEVRTEMSGLFTPTKEESEDEMSESEFNSYIGIDCQKFFSSVEYEKSDISSETGKFYYRSGEEIVTVKLSKNTDLLPENMKTLKTTEINGIEIYLAEDKKNYYAAGSNNGINYFITFGNTDEKQFKKLIKEFTENF